MRKDKDYTYCQDLMFQELRDLEDMQSPHNAAFRLGQLWAKRLLQDAVLRQALLSGKLKCHECVPQKLLPENSSEELRHAVVAGIESQIRSHPGYTATG